MPAQGSSSQTIKASDLFVRCLEAEGVTHIYGVPGEENADLMISLLDSSIDFVERPVCAAGTAVP